MQKTLRKLFFGKKKQTSAKRQKIAVRKFQKPKKKIYDCPPTLSPADCVKELSKRKKAQTITDIAKIPPVEAILTRDHGILSIPQTRQTQMALLDIGKNQVWALALDDFYLDTFFLSQISRANDLGLKVVKKAKTSIRCLSALAEMYGSTLVDKQVKSPEEIEREKSQAIYFFEEIVNEAVQSFASDIHICVRYNQKKPTGSILHRVHGLVHNVGTYPASRLETMLSVAYANTYITDKLSRSRESFSIRENQSCTMRVALNTANQHGDVNGLEKIELRYQHLTVRDGFDTIIRLLRVGDNEKSFTLEELGYSASQEKILSLAAKNTTGAIFVSGVTGSGKTTTLKTLLTMNQSQNFKKKTYTIEDPPEFKLYGISQISVQRNNDKTDISPFAAAMRDVMRADPDRIMVGEVRDKDSASMLQTMVLSGHQVFATIHTTSALGIINRLCSEEIGLTVQTLTSDRFLSLLIYQRLLPVSCPDCKVPAVGKLPEPMLHILKKHQIDIDSIYLRNEKGCENCDFRGTIGQTVCAEVVELDATLLRYLRKGQNVEAYEYWRKQRRSYFDDSDSVGKTAFEHGLYKVSQGIIDPIDMEEAFEPFEKYQVVEVDLPPHQNNHSNLSSAA